MATRSLIGYKTEKGNYKIVYCHFDGYPEGVGKTLKTYYNSLDQIKAIVKLGDLSHLQKSIKKPRNHSYENQVKGYSVFYGRDRGEKNVNAKTFDRITQAAKFYWDCEYAYIWDNAEIKGYCLHTGTPEVIKNFNG